MFTSKKPNSVKNYVLCCLSQKMFELVKNKKIAVIILKKVIFYKKKSKKKGGTVQSQQYVFAMNNVEVNFFSVFNFL